jgi:hypothetical protein
MLGGLASAFRRDEVLVTIVESADRQNVDAVSSSDSVLRQFPLGQPWTYIASVSLAVFLFVADIVLPRGATVAIGYCLVSVLATGTRRRGFLLGISIVCTILTWGGFLWQVLAAKPHFAIHNRHQPVCHHFDVVSSIDRTTMM